VETQSHPKGATTATHPSVSSRSRPAALGGPATGRGASQQCGARLVSAGRARTLQHPQACRRRRRAKAENLLQGAGLPGSEGHPSGGSGAARSELAVHFQEAGDARLLPERLRPGHGRTSAGRQPSRPTGRWRPTHSGAGGLPPPVPHVCDYSSSRWPRKSGRSSASSRTKKPNPGTVSGGRGRSISAAAKRPTGSPNRRRRPRCGLSGRMALPRPGRRLPAILPASGESCGARPAGRTREEYDNISDCSDDDV